MNSALWQ